MRNLLVLALLAPLAAACSTADSSPLIFGQGLTVGISVGASAANNATPEIVVGVKQADIAVVPTVVPPTVSLDGVVAPTRNIRSFSPAPNDSRSAEDALSTFGSFSSDAQVGNVGLGIFFATGVAAQNISDGFRCGVSNNGATGCQPAANQGGGTPPG